MDLNMLSAVPGTQTAFQKHGLCSPPSQDWYLLWGTERKVRSPLGSQGAQGGKSKENPQPQSSLRKKVLTGLQQSGKASRRKWLRKKLLEKYGAHSTLNGSQCPAWVEIKATDWSFQSQMQPTVGICGLRVSSRLGSKKIWV